MGIGDALALADPTNPNAYIPPQQAAAPGPMYVNPVQVALGLPSSSAPPVSPVPTAPPVGPSQDYGAALSSALQAQGASSSPASPAPPAPKQINFVTPGSGGPSGGYPPAAPSAPLNIQSSLAGARVAPAHDVQIASGAGLAAKQNAATEAKDAIDQVARAT